MKPPILVIGAGAAGIIAAWRAAELGAKVCLVEKTDRIGTKILVSGCGKCNITHDGPLEQVLKAFRPAEARFIRPACYRFPPSAISDMLTARGLEVYTREDGRVFPVHQTAKDVVAVLESYLEDAGVEIRKNTRVQSMTVEAGAIRGVETDKGAIASDHVILCVGGSSYPKTGTTGDGYPWIPTLGHTLVPILAALAPMELEMEGMSPRAGIALVGVILKARLHGKEIARWQGDFLFTHRGISGPCALGISREVAEVMNEGQVTVELDLVPDLKFEVLQEEFRLWKQNFPRRQLVSLVREIVPERLVDEVLAVAGIEPTLTGQAWSKKELNRLTEVVKGWPIGVVSHVPLEKGEVVAGGVALDEVDPHSMRSHRCQGLYLAGEILDVAGPVGGYNLQAAWATGFVAGETAAHDWLG